jgi:hypothetical protein
MAILQETLRSEASRQSVCEERVLSEFLLYLMAFFLVLAYQSAMTILKIIQRRAVTS